MYKSITISSQLLALADRLGFGKICSEENVDKRYRHFTARTQLYAMMIAQLTGQGDNRERQRPVPCRCQHAYHEDEPCPRKREASVRGIPEILFPPD